MDDNDGCLPLIVMGVIVFFIFKGCSSDDVKKVIDTGDLDAILKGVKQEVVTPFTKGEWDLSKSPEVKEGSLNSERKKLNQDVIRLEKQLDDYKGAD
jgi:hypothetical protein